MKKTNKKTVVLPKRKDITDMELVEMFFMFLISFFVYFVFVESKYITVWVHVPTFPCTCIAFLRIELKRVKLYQSVSLLGLMFFVFMNIGLEFEKQDSLLIQTLFATFLTNRIIYIIYKIKEYFVR